jgi:hypothetical protein
MLTKEILPAAAAARDVSLHAIDRGRAAQEAGHEQDAKQYFVAAKSLGDYLLKPERLAAAQLAAKAIVAMADEQLSGLDSPDRNVEVP